MGMLKNGITVELPGQIKHIQARNGLKINTVRQHLYLFRKQFVSGKDATGRRQDYPRDNKNSFFDRIAGKDFFSFTDQHQRLINIFAFEKEEKQLPTFYLSSSLELLHLFFS